MKKLIFLRTLLFWAGSSMLIAQETQDSIRLSDSFLKDLDKAFSFGIQPECAEISTLKPQELTTDFLHELVGPVEKIAPTLSLPELSPKALTESAYIWKSGRYGILNDGSFTGLDIAALGKYIRPKEITKRHLRQLAKESQAIMDKYFPMEGCPIYSTETKVQEPAEPELSRGE